MRLYVCVYYANVLINLMVTLINKFRSKEEEGFKVIYITDISTGGETPKQMLWTYDMLKSNMKEKKASLVRFNFLDIQVSALLLLT